MFIFKYIESRPKEVHGLGGDNVFREDIPSIPNPVSETVFVDIFLYYFFREKRFGCDHGSWLMSGS